MLIKTLVENTKADVFMNRLEFVYLPAGSEIII